MFFNDTHCDETKKFTNIGVVFGLNAYNVVTGNYGIERIMFISVIIPYRYKSILMVITEE